MIKTNSEKIDDDFSGRIGWQSPSNLAIVKYWGKYGRQLPKNTSISLTLNEAATRTFVVYHRKEEKNDSTISVNFTFEGVKNVGFASRINKFLEALSTEFFPFLKTLHLEIESSNSFPHSSGIASSASAMSALALCLCDIECQLSNKDYDDSFYQQASLIARLGSGSAARSVYPYVALWGEHPDIKNSSNQYAIPCAQEVHEIFRNFHDDILIVSAAEKSVSSSAGHALMDNNVYAHARYQQANQRIVTAMDCMRSGDVEGLGKITEDEALTLHALMMCSDPSYVLVEPGTLSIIQNIRAFRAETHIPVYFSLDAGPNIHLLYPDDFKQEVSEFVNAVLLPFCQNGKIIKDKVGTGPQKLV